MDSTISSSASLSIPKFRCFDPTYAYSPTAANHRRSFSNFSPTFKSSSRVNMVDSENSERKIVNGDAGYVLEDVPHLSDYIPDLPTYPNPLQDNHSYSVVKQYFVNVDDTIVVHKDSPRGTHFRRAGPRQRVYFESDEVYACIVTCGGLCPGLNTVIREIVCCLHYMYGVNKVLGIEGACKEVEEASYTTSGALLLKLLYSKSYWIGIGPFLEASKSYWIEHSLVITTVVVKLKVQEMTETFAFLKRIHRVNRTG
ncbi:hypothetical protein QYF36_004502 [Acer negundo]|nr:hypothetical protein QYF36_004502 [Acer negundo]